jgi:hypothetical protein
MEQTPRVGMEPISRAARRYREKARSVRKIAARTRFAETKKQLLWIAYRYTQLAEHAESIGQSVMASQELIASQVQSPD